MSDIERFMAKVDKQENGCWLWTGAKDRGGYGEFHILINGQKKMEIAHRFSYEHFVAKLQGKQVIDHLCRNRGCVNPQHLEAVSTHENIMRGIGLASINSSKTHCKNGHEFTAENTYFRKGAGRQCRMCRVIENRKYRTGLQKKQGAMI